MAVIETQKWLHTFNERCKETSIKEINNNHIDLLCKPLENVFEKLPPQAIQYELLQYGLFDPKDWYRIEYVMEELEKQKVWKRIEHEFLKLKKRWKGPDIPIYIFPIKKGKLRSEKEQFRKNGVAYKNALFLFVSTELHKEELKAMLAHEYNHVCRINLIDIPPKITPLKESLVVEGLGEYAVNELYGEKWLAPWVNLYSLDTLQKIWKEHFINSLNLTGIDAHQKFLYGQKRSPFTKWIGYAIGYHIVHSYVEKNGPFTSNELYQKSADTLIKGSAFRLE
ncbi:DUF2268 domain-containing protein [Rummeliibacillus stabekisii]|uniref:DUF2268 domain-containing protein n=1 Tax=Rummeliibacillus stabekisii TaxID=241244 RepID=A0A143HAJ9_9BACL|nr:DUF2268 domain-containing putative Zn-dependent protease [Rummeliibacillus stabekisii]AMW98744.1 hypothetical protein ATY39_04355 [Rummeliibacillus stabekisii]